MTIHVAVLPGGPFSRTEWERCLTAMARVVTWPVEPDIEFFLTRDADIAALNAARLGCEGPTNILSFPSETGGSLALSVDTLRREALLYGQDVEEHARRLLAHGLAHLAGYDHGSEMDAVCERMLGAWDAPVGSCSA